MENKQPSIKSKANNELKKSKPDNFDLAQSGHVENKESEIIATNEAISSVKVSSDNVDKSKQTSESKSEVPKTQKKPIKPPKIEDKPFAEFVSMHLIPGLKSSIEKKGAFVIEINLIEGKRPVVGGNCWMVYCEISNQRRFWLCFNKEAITSDKTILLAESNSEPSIVESFLIDEKKTTLALLISRVLQRLNGQKWIGAN